MQFDHVSYRPIVVVLADNRILSFCLDKISVVWLIEFTDTHQNTNCSDVCGLLFLVALCGIKLFVCLIFHKSLETSQRWNKLKTLENLQ